MTSLEKIIMKDLRENKKSILEELETMGYKPYTIKFQEEEGEVLITRCMEIQEIEKAVNKAVFLIFPGCKAVKISKREIYLDFEIN